MPVNARRVPGRLHGVQRDMPGRRSAADSGLELLQPHPDDRHGGRHDCHTKIGFPRLWFYPEAVALRSERRSHMPHSMGGFHALTHFPVNRRKRAC